MAPEQAAALVEKLSTRTRPSVEYVPMPNRSQKG